MKIGVCRKRKKYSEVCGGPGLIGALGLEFHIGFVTNKFLLHYGGFDIK